MWQFIGDDDLVLMEELECASQRVNARISQSGSDVFATASSEAASLDVGEALGVW